MGYLILSLVQTFLKDIEPVDESIPLPKASSRVVKTNQTISYQDLV